MDSFTVALVALDGQHVPDWVESELEQAGVELTAAECETQDDLLRLAADADLVWVFGGSRVVIAEILPSLARCGAILRTGTGTDNIPVAEATEAGILVATTPQAGSEAVAEHTLGLLLAVVRKIAVQDRLVRTGVWNARRAWPQWCLQGKTLGLIGFGSIARALVSKLRGFDLTVLAHDPFVAGDVVVSHGAQPVDLDVLLDRAMIVSLHCPLTPTTTRLIDDRALGRMRPDTILLNTARGPLIDERALIRALTEGRIAGAGLDVFGKEPIARTNPLLAMDTVVLTPHIAGYSDTFFADSWRLSTDTIIDLANGRWPRSCANPDVNARWQLAPPADRIGNLQREHNVT